jgi:hypothetical protein
MEIFTLELAAGALALTLSRRKVLPKERVVDVTTAVELERLLETNALLSGGGFCVGSLGSVQRVHVGLMMLLVVKLHDLARDERLKCLIRVREIGELVATGGAGHGGSWLNYEGESWRRNCVSASRLEFYARPRS